MGKSARWKEKRWIQRDHIQRVTLKVKRTSSSLDEKDEFFLFEQFAVCKHIRSSSKRNDTWVNLHHHTLAK